MKKLLLILVLCLSFVSSAYADLIEDTLKNHTYYTYSEEEINENIYTVYVYLDKIYDVYGSNTNFIAYEKQEAFYVGDNKLITPRIEGEREVYYIVCKQKNNDNIFTQKCLSAAKLLYTDKEKKISLIEIEKGIEGKKLSNTELKDNYNENGIMIYSSMIGYGSYANFSKNVFRMPGTFSTSFNSDFEEKVSVEGGFYSSSFVFYNNSFFGMNVGSYFRSKEDILDLINGKGELTYPERKLQQQFLSEVQIHIEEIESQKLDLGRGFTPYKKVKQSLLSETYEIIGWDHISQKDGFEGLYAAYYDIGINDKQKIYTDEEVASYTNEESHKVHLPGGTSIAFDSSAEAIKYVIENGLRYTDIESDYTLFKEIPKSFVDSKEIDWAKIKKIDSKFFDIYTSDITSEYHGKNIFYKLALYAKIDGIYYFSGYIERGAFILNPVGKRQRAMSIYFPLKAYEENKVISDKVVKFFSSMSELEAGKIKQKLEMLLKKKKVQTEREFNKVVDTEDDEKQDKKLRILVKKIDILREFINYLDMYDVKAKRMQTFIEQIEQLNEELDEAIKTFENQHEKK